MGTNGRCGAWAGVRGNGSEGLLWVDLSRRTEFGRMTVFGAIRPELPVRPVGWRCPKGVIWTQALARRTVSTIFTRQIIRWPLYCVSDGCTLAQKLLPIASRH
jgi:hypothetical protein